MRSLALAVTSAARERALRVAEAPRRAMVVVALASLIAAMLGTLTRSARQPSVTDELSYLLAARTFAAGRITNPPHPMWRHFEAEHVLVRPTYQSKYPPGQGLVLAVGEVLAGRPILGVWLSYALLGAALCWMLQAWVGLRCAFFGALAYMPWLAASYWSFTYWGGTVAACGGALLYGAIRRLERDPRAAIGVWMGVGVLVLATTRMYEGALTALPAAGYVLYWLFKGDTSRRSRLRVAVPLGLVLVSSTFLLGYYNRVVTGDAATLPYVQYARQYDRTPLFLWMDPRDSLERRRVDTASTEEIEVYLNERVPRRFIITSLRRFGEFALFFFPVPFALALVLRGRLAVRDRWIAGAIGVMGLAMVGMTFSVWFSPHYAAPLTALALVVGVAGVQWVHRLPIGRGAWRRWLSSPMLLWGCVALAVAKGLTYLVVKGPTDQTHWSAARGRFEARLHSMGGRHLVLVHYGRHHKHGEEWISNAPDIDRATVVWARDLGADRNQALLDYFRDRRVWWVDVDDERGPFRLEPLREPIIEPERQPPGATSSCRACDQRGAERRGSAAVALARSRSLPNDSRPIAASTQISGIAGWRKRPTAAGPPATVTK